MSEDNESVFTYAAPRLRFGPGAADEIWHDLVQLQARTVIVVTDPGVRETGAPDRIADQARSNGVDAVVHDSARVEPTDASLAVAIERARADGPFDAVVAVGGGSSIDTAKAVNLMLTNPGDLMDYVNAPIGSGRAPERPLLPLIAVPTTTGTGAESTTICVLDVLDLEVKTGISHERLRPQLAVVDPRLSASQPAGVTASAGMDILCHALESWTARPYTRFARKAPEQRVPYCGANPVADLWSERAMTLLAAAFRTAVLDGDDESARADMALAATFAGLGFGNAGVHVPHANAYPVAGQVRDFHPRDYPGDHAMVPHGIAVALTAPEAFRWTFDADPDRHLSAARLLDPGQGPRWAAESRDVLPGVLVDLMRDLDLPNGLQAVGYDQGDVGSLVDGAMKQQRLLATSPKPVTSTDLAQIFTRSLRLWD